MTKLNPPALLILTGAALLGGCEGDWFDLTNMPSPLPTFCEAGGLLEGEGCRMDAECVSGLACAGGQCSAPRPEGGPCQRPEECAEGLLCNCDGRECELIEGYCHLPGVLGEGEACQDDESCEGGLCHWGLGHFCAPPGLAGELCVKTNECVEGLVCNRGFHPARCTERSGLGGVCSTRGDCLGGQVCAWDEGVKRCRVAYGLEGDRCDGSAVAMDTTCGAGLVCNLHHGFCTAPAGEGEPCGGWGSCAEGLTCNHGFDPAVCAPMRGGAEGTPCYWSHDCQDGLLCGDARCQRPGFRGQGEPCLEEVECGAHLRCRF